MEFLKNIFRKRVDSTLTVTSANGFHLRPISKFVNEVKKFDATVKIIAHKQEVSANQVPKVLLLALDKGDSFTLSCRGKEAKEASEYLSSFFVKLMDEDREEEKVILQDNELYKGKSLKGETISKGIGTGVLVSYFTYRTDYYGRGVPFEEALLISAKELDRLYTDNMDKEEADIFLAQKELLASELFQKEFDKIDEEIKKLRGSRFDSRIADYKDIKKRIESHMGISTAFEIPADENSIIIADELLPSEVEELSKFPVKGVILRKGSSTSHASILLRSFKIPSIICKEEIITTGEYFYSLLDASSGQFIHLPEDDDLKKAEIRLKAHKKQEDKNYSKRLEETRTKDGKIIKVLANITDLNSAKEAKELGADGVGLLRTEFLFTRVKPSLEQQSRTYAEIFKLFDDITIRTLDIGGDKSLPYINIEEEDNPFLGVRGIRFSLQEQTLFKEQLLAIFKAVGRGILTPTKTQIKIMFPMVSNTKEFTQAKKIAQTVAKENNIDIEKVQFGIMLEVPSVIFAIKEFDKLVDFYSIGTNDLTQYLFAIERTHPTLTADATSPMLLSALKQIIETTNRPISICGELAGIEEVTSGLIEMGYSSLSVSAKLIPSIKERIRLV